MNAINVGIATLLIVLPVMSSGQSSLSPEDQIRHHLRLDAKVTFDIWSVRAKILTIVHIGQPWQNVEKAMAVYGLDRSSETKQTPCWPGDNGLLCEFSASTSDPNGKRKYWIEFFYAGADIKNQVLEDVAVTLFEGKTVTSTSKFYVNE